MGLKQPGGFQEIPRGPTSGSGDFSKILSLFADTPREQVQELLERGLLADLRDGNLAEVNRDDSRKFLGLIRGGVNFYPTLSFLC